MLNSSQMFQKYTSVNILHLKFNFKFNCIKKIFIFSFKFDTNKKRLTELFVEIISTETNLLKIKKSLKSCVFQYGTNTQQLFV